MRSREVLLQEGIHRGARSSAALSFPLPRSTPGCSRREVPPPPGESGAAAGNIFAHLFQHDGGERGRIVVHGPGREIMGLIDHQVRLAGLVDARGRHTTQSRAGGKDIVVIADDDIRILAQSSCNSKGQTWYCSPRSRNVRALTSFLGQDVVMPCSCSLR